MTNQLITHVPYHVFERPWLQINGIRNMIWEMYEDFVNDDDTGEYIPTWEYYIEDEETQYSVFHASVISYLAFGDFNKYEILNDEKDIEHYYSVYDEDAWMIDEDTIRLFHEMKLCMQNTAWDIDYMPIVPVW